jgi:hypothetical protein
VENPPSPLELLHPQGFAQGTLLLGKGSPAILRPESTGGPAIDLAVVGPVRDRDAGHELASSVAPNGIVYVVGRRALRRISADLRARRFRPCARFVHLPDLERSSRIVALGGAAERQLRAERGGLARFPLAGAVLRRRRPTGTLFAGRDAKPLSWLTVDVALGDVTIQTSQHGDVRTSVIRTRDTIAKVGAGSGVVPEGLGEVEALRQVAPGAGIPTPSLIAETSIAGAPVVVETVVPGIPAAAVIARDPSLAARVAEQLALWLAEWNARTAVERTLSVELLGGDVLDPQLAGRWRSLEGTRAPAVAVHQDLTMTNVLVEDDRFGVVDWASARAQGLPLVDFFYAVVDARAAADRYADRVAAFHACFAPRGDWFSRVAALERRLRERLDISEELADLAFQACWAQHAANESRRRETGREFRALAAAARRLR